MCMFKYTCIHICIYRLHKIYIHINIDIYIYIYIYIHMYMCVETYELYLKDKKIYLTKTKTNWMHPWWPAMELLAPLPPLVLVVADEPAALLGPSGLAIYKHGGSGSLQLPGEGLGQQGAVVPIALAPCKKHPAHLVLPPCGTCMWAIW